MAAKVPPIRTSKEDEENVEFTSSSSMASLSMQHIFQNKLSVLSLNRPIVGGGGGGGPKVLMNGDDCALDTRLHPSRMVHHRAHHRLRQMMSSLKFDLLITLVLIVIDIVCLIGEIVTKSLQTKDGSKETESKAERNRNNKLNELNHIFHWISFVIVLAFAGDNALRIFMFGCHRKFSFWFDASIVWITFLLETAVVCIHLATPKESIGRWLLQTNRFVMGFLIVWKLIRIKHAILHVIHICLHCNRPRSFFVYSSKSLADLSFSTTTSTTTLQCSQHNTHKSTIKIKANNTNNNKCPPRIANKLPNKTQSTVFTV